VKFDNQLRYAVQIIDTYQGEIPLHVWLKDFFRVHPQMGSRDRRIVSTMVYGHYRLGHAVKMHSPEKRIIAGLFLCQDQPLELLNYFNPDLDKQVSLPLTEKIAYYQATPDGAEFRPEDIFPWKDQLSAGIDHLSFCRSFLRQPDLFLRIRPGHETTVREKLGAAAAVEFIPPATMRLPNGFKVEDYFTPDREIVVQDYNSQRVAAFFQPDHTPEYFWDACAASGGKSILAHDLYPKMEIFVSDIRDSILRNLRSRFKTADIKKYHAFLADLATQAPPASAAGADLVLVDAPCTGSGTWGRTPEDAWFFKPEKIRRYSEVQKSILSNIAPQLSPDASLVYCTCSVFRMENEEMAAFIRDTLGLKEQARENLKGYDMRADTLFASRYTR
jgi:16S rRNA (cytosine967-C5)-methyltransferase